MDNVTIFREAYYALIEDQDAQCNEIAGVRSADTEKKEGDDLWIIRVNNKDKRNSNNGAKSIGVISCKRKI